MASHEDAPTEHESNTFDTAESPAGANTTANYAPLAARDAEPYDLSGPAEPPSTAGEDVHATHDEQHELEQPTPILPPRPAHEETAANEEAVPPEVASLQAMFPDFDATIVQSVLQSVNGSQERAADVLLGMSDPNYTSQEHDAVVQEPTLTQTELDEQLARRLMLEDQQAQASWHPDQQYPYGPQQGQRQRGGAPPASGQAWSAPWGGGPPGQQQQQQGTGQGRDTMSEVSEQFSKIAESGKKTFSSFMTKVKAKMSEFDQNRNASSSGAGTQPSWGSGTPSRIPSGAPPQSQASYQTETYQPPSQPPPSTHPGLARAASSERSISVGGYDAAPAPTSGFSAPTSAPPPSERIPPRPGSAGPPPAGNVDPTKIGMLPKRPVSLLGSPAQSASGPGAPSRALADDDDELEYVENPFEEGRK